MRLKFWRGRQQAGSQSTQIQAHSVTQNYVIVTADDARSIAERQQTEAIRAAFTDEAREVGAARAKQVGDRVVSRLDEENLLAAFKEPSFQALLAKSAIGAAQTDEQADHDLLANILADRARKGDVRRRRIGLDRAIEVVDKVELGDLRALTIIFMLARMRPIGAFVEDGLNSHEEMYEMLLSPEDDLPTGRNLLDRLDLLNLIRINQLAPFRKMTEFWFPAVSGWASAGILKNHEQVNDLWQGFHRRGFQPILTNHELAPDRFRLGYAHPNFLRDAILEAGAHNEAQADKIVQYAERWFGLSTVPDPVMLNTLTEAFDQRPTLCRIRAWFENLPNGAFFSDAGVILARAYAEYCGASEKINNWVEMDIDT